MLRLLSPLRRPGSFCFTPFRAISHHVRNQVYTDGEKGCGEALENERPVEKGLWRNNKEPITKSYLQPRDHLTATSSENSSETGRGTTQPGPSQPRES